MISTDEQMKIYNETIRFDIDDVKVFDFWFDNEQIFVAYHHKDFERSTMTIVKFDIDEVLAPVLERHDDYCYKVLTELETREGRIEAIVEHLYDDFYFDDTLVQVMIEEVLQPANLSEGQFITLRPFMKKLYYEMRNKLKNNLPWFKTMEAYIEGNTPSIKCHDATILFADVLRQKRELERKYAKAA